MNSFYLIFNVSNYLPVYKLPKSVLVLKILGCSALSQNDISAILVKNVCEPKMKMKQNVL